MNAKVRNPARTLTPDQMASRAKTKIGVSVSCEEHELANEGAPTAKKRKTGGSVGRSGVLPDAQQAAHPTAQGLRVAAGPGSKSKTGAAAARRVTSSKPKKGVVVSVKRAGEDSFVAEFSNRQMFSFDEQTLKNQPMGETCLRALVMKESQQDAP